MTKNYETVTAPSGAQFIQYEENGVVYSIPTDPGNSDYQAYLKSLEEQANDQSL
jgi:hypothetical protein